MIKRNLIFVLCTKNVGTNGANALEMQPMVAILPWITKAATEADRTVNPTHSINSSLEIHSPKDKPVVVVETNKSVDFDEI